MSNRQDNIPPQATLWTLDGLSTACEEFPLVDGHLSYYSNFLSLSEGESFFSQLTTETPWQQDHIHIAGKSIPIPRLQCWYGDKDCAYRYSGIDLKPLPWTAMLLNIKNRIENITKCSFNSVLINLYRDGKDSVSWHSDDEQELGRNPTIASLSLGEIRDFQLKHKNNDILAPIKIPLANGSLLVMKNQTQHYWLHQIPKTRRPVKPRINLTFRQVKIRR